MQIKVIPYDFKPAKFMVPTMKGYWVHVFAFFDGQKIHHFYHQPDFMENLCTANEFGVSTEVCSFRMLVTPKKHPEIFNEIEEYVRCSLYDQES